MKYLKNKQINEWGQRENNLEQIPVIGFDYVLYVAALSRH
jgi:hypothetical protein